ncbi:MAG: outer membrane beta-barrel protein [Chitinophagaceae bacterium]
MSEDLHPIDDLFRSGLNGKEETPTPAVWEAIEKELDKKDRKPIAGFFRMSGRAAAVALIIITGAALFAAGYFIRDAQEEKKGIGHKAFGIEEGKGTGKEALGTKGESLKPVDKTEIKLPASSSINDGEAPKLTSEPVGSANTKSIPEKNTVKKVTKQVKATNPSITGAASETLQSSSISETVNTESQEQHIKWEIATALPPVEEHLLPASSTKIPTSDAVISISKNNKYSKAVVKQTTPTKIPVINKNAAGLQVPKFSLTPYVAFQNHSVKLKDDGSNWGKNMRDDMERTEQLPSKVSVGVLADFRIAKNISLQSGLGLMQLDVTIQPKQIKAEKDIDGKVKYRLDCSAGTYFINPKQGNYPRPGDSITTQMATNSLKYLNIPLNVKYHFGSNKLQFFATAGTGINILTSQNLDAMVKHQYQYYGGRTTNLKSSYFNGMIGGGATYFVGKRIGIYVSPQYNFALTSMNEGLPVKSLPRTFNMQTGITIKL